jgi:hypothetical protein
MGGGSSKPIIGTSTGFRGPEASYDALLRVQERDNMAFGRIFKRMIENITPKELRELYSINQCKKYHFALGNALAKIFYFTPVQGMAKGAQPIYWLRLDSAKKEEYDEQFFKNCFQVAYFYIRLLQIFCALSISTKSNEALPYSGGPYGGPMGQFFRMPGFSGGAGFLDLSIEDIFDKYVDSSNHFRGKYDYMSLNDDTLRIEKGGKKVTANLEYTGRQIKITNVYYDNEKIESVPKYISIIKDKEYDYKSLDRRRLDDVLIEIIKKIIKPYEERKGIVKKKDTDGARGIAPPAERKELRVEYLVDRLSGTANKPYAIARALQLLDLTPHETYTTFDPYGRGGKTYAFTTHVFDFTYSAIIGNAPAILSEQQRKAFQEQNNTLANVLGLSALEKLYFDDWMGISSQKDAKGTQKDAKGTDSYRIGMTQETKTEYTKFLNAIQCMYKDTSIAEISPNNITDLRSFSVANLYAKEKGAEAGPKTLKIETQENKAKIAALKKLQSQLFGLQLAHNARVKAFIQRNIIADTPRGPMPNPKIFTEGLSRINKIGVDARRLLLDYYVKAEAIYNQGYMIIKGVAPRNVYGECSVYLTPLV